MITYRFMVDAAHVDINLHTYVDAYLSSELCSWGFNDFQVDMV